MSSVTDVYEWDWKSMYCCDDDWAVWLRFETWIWAILLLIQLSMVSFLVVHGRQNKAFREAFYVFFVSVTLVDCALVLLRPTPDYDETVFGTAFDVPFVGQETTIIHVMNRITKHLVVPALGHAQPLLLTAIAVNRFTAFAFPLKHASMWRTRTVVVVMALLATMSVTLGAASPVVLTIRHSIKCSKATRNERVGLECDLSMWHSEWWHFQTFIYATLITIISAICCAVSFVLNIGSIAMLVVLRTAGRLQRKGPELQLFAHSMWMLLLQSLLAFQDIVSIADNPDAIVDELGLDGLGITWLDFGHSSEWLAGVNATRTWTGDKLELEPGCVTWFDDDRQPTCNVWYLLLLGKLELREEYPYFSVRTLQLCLFALSGSVFLLIISGNVRNAYFNFYLKWQCLSNKMGNAKVFTRAARRAPTSTIATS